MTIAAAAIVICGRYQCWEANSDDCVCGLTVPSRQTVTTMDDNDRCGDCNKRLAVDSTGIDGLPLRLSSFVVITDGGKQTLMTVCVELLSLAVKR